MVHHEHESFTRTRSAFKITILCDHCALILHFSVPSVFAVLKNKSHWQWEPLIFGKPNFYAKNFRVLHKKLSGTGLSQERVIALSEIDTAWESRFWLWLNAIVQACFGNTQFRKLWSNAGRTNCVDPNTKIQRRWCENRAEFRRTLQQRTMNIHKCELHYFYVPSTMAGVHCEFFYKGTKIQWTSVCLAQKIITFGTLSPL